MFNPQMGEMGGFAAEEVLISSLSSNHYNEHTMTSMITTRLVGNLETLVENLGANLVENLVENLGARQLVEKSSGDHAKWKLHIYVHCPTCS